MTQLMTLFEALLSEATDHTVVGFFPGRFQPFHPGHHGAYNQLVDLCGRDHTYILTSNNTSTYNSPLTFQDKQALITTMFDIPADHVVETSTPYRIPRNLEFDEFNTIVLFAVSSKDMQEDPRFVFPEDGRMALRDDGVPKYMQRYPGNISKCLPLTTHAYVIEVDVESFDVDGRTIVDATELRKLLIQPEDKARDAFEQIYGTFNKEIFDMLRSRIEAKVLDLES